MGIGSIIGAIAAPLIGGIFSAKGQAQANQDTQASTQVQMDFQKEMRATQYQTAMADMRAAGLNPMLAYQQGGAGNLSGSSYTAQNELEPIGDAMETSTNTAMTMRRQNADLEAIEKSNRAIEAGIVKTRQDTRTSSSTERLNEQQKRRSQAETNLTDQIGARARLDYRFREMDMNSAKAAQTQARTDETINKSQYGRILRWIDRAGRAINPFSTMAGQHTPSTSIIKKR